MAKKKEPSIDEALNIFLDVMQRASLFDYVHVNSDIISENPKGNSIIIPVEQTLWEELLKKKEFTDHLQELPLSDERTSLLTYIDNIDNEKLWNNVDINEFFDGKIIHIKVASFEYDIPLNKNALPIRLKKTEFNNISYRVFIDKHVVLALKKKFVYEGIENCNFSMIRLFKVV